jgi:hypothetical protein
MAGIRLASCEVHQPSFPFPLLQESAMIRRCDIMIPICHVNFVKAVLFLGLLLLGQFRLHLPRMRGLLISCSFLAQTRNKSSPTRSEELNSQEMVIVTNSQER